MKNLVHSLLLLAFAVSAIACDPKHDSVDERQRQIIKANASLARMDAINAELTGVGISVDKAPGASKPIWSQPEPKLQIFKLKLEEFISHAQNVIAISNRSDVMWAGVPKLQKRLAAAQSLLAEIKQQLKNVPGELGSKFWDRWNECHSALETGIDLHGVRVWQGYSTFEDRAIEGLERSRRQELAKHIQNHMECSRTVRHGNNVLYANGEATVSNNSEPPARFGDLKEKDRNLESLLHKLEKLEAANEKK